MNKQMIRRTIDKRLEPLRAHPSATARPAGGWLRAIRSALGMSTSDLARRLDVTPVAVRKLERSELAGTARLETLARAADAMGCDLVYAFVPRTSLDDFVDRRADEVARAEVQRIDTTMALEAQRTSESERARIIEDKVRDLRDSRDLWRAGP